MAKIIEEKFYGGAEERIKRLGLDPLIEEVRRIAQGFLLLVEERKDGNGGAAVRKLLDAQFHAASGWKTVKSGDVDWTKCYSVNGTSVCVGVEVQFSARSDLLVMDVAHLRRAITKGHIDIGILLVPSDKLGYYLTDRAPRFSDAVRHVREARAEDLPLIIMALHHDGPGPPLKKQLKRRKKVDDADEVED